MRLADGCYVRFIGTRHEIALRLPLVGETVEPVLSSHAPNETASVGLTSPRTAPRSSLELHAALGHCSDRRIRSSKISTDVDSSLTCITT